MNLTFGMNLARETPQAKFRITARGYTATDENLFALDFKVDITKTSS
jgi:hypothetical protein